MFLVSLVTLGRPGLRGPLTVELVEICQYKVLLGIYLQLFANENEAFQQLH